MAGGFQPQRIYVLTISDTRTATDDRSGDTLSARLTEAGHALAGRAVARDEVEAIRAAVRGALADGGVDVVLTTGGTGLTGRDVTPEAVEPLLSKRMDSFAYAFHALSAQKIGTTAILSRALAGLIDGAFVFCLPGSPGACRDAWDGIIGPQLDARTQPNNLVLLKPRLRER